MYHVCSACYNKQTLNAMLNKTMGDLNRQTETWIERVKTGGYMYSIMWDVSGIRFVKQTYRSGVTWIVTYLQLY